MPSADLEQLLATLRVVANERMTQHRLRRRAQPAPTAAATQPAPVAKAQPSPAVKAPTPEELLRKARALRSAQTQAPAAATAEERRRQLRERHQQIMQKAL